MSLTYAVEVLKKIDVSRLIDVADLIYKKAYANGGTVYVAGVGGSAFTASHFSADIYKYASDGVLDSISLTDNISTVTAITNDLGWDKLFTYQLTFANKQDVLVAFSVHGGTKEFSGNLTEAFLQAKKKKMPTVSFTGHDGGEIKKLSTINVNVNSKSTPIIEGIHSLLAHIVVEHLKKRINQ